MSAFKNVQTNVCQPLDVSLHLLNNKDAQLLISISLLHFVTVACQYIQIQLINNTVEILLTGNRADSFLLENMNIVKYCKMFSFHDMLVAWMLKKDQLVFHYELFM